MALLQQPRPVADGGFTKRSRGAAIPFLSGVKFMGNTYDGNRSSGIAPRINFVMLFLFLWFVLDGRGSCTATLSERLRGTDPARGVLTTF